MEVNKEKIQYILQFFLGKGENASQGAEIVNGVYGFDTVIANYVQFWFRKFRSGIFDVKVAPHTGRTVIENVDKISEIIEVNRHISNRIITLELKIDHKIVLSHLSKVGIQREARCLGASPINNKKHDGSNFHLRSLGQTEINRPIS
ncbi:histone-lysine N-methyltransferase SETMAR [Trichonephila clavipes]|nr:histone-lysine N-methyltransferase SETMAR [Trichonephila clavipes]